MGPITNVGSALSGAAGAHALSIDGGPKSASAGGVDGAGRAASKLLGASSTLTSVSATRVSASVTSMLAELGGGLENDKLLRTIIALLILSALLDSRRGDDADALKALNAGASEPMASGSSVQVSQFQLSIFVENSIQQYSGAPAPGTELASNPGADASAGVRFDVSA